MNLKDHSEIIPKPELVQNNESLTRIKINSEGLTGKFKSKRNKASSTDLFLRSDVLIKKILRMIRKYYMTVMKRSKSKGRSVLS